MWCDCSSRTTLEPLLSIDYEFCDLGQSHCHTDVPTFIIYLWVPGSTSHCVFWQYLNNIKKVSNKFDFTWETDQDCFISPNIYCWKPIKQLWGNCQHFLSVHSFHPSEQFFLLQLLDWVLRGAAQVMFVNNPLSGLIIFAGLILQNYWWALNGFVGTLFATISALILQQNRFEHSLISWQKWTVQIPYLIDRFVKWLCRKILHCAELTLSCAKKKINSLIQITFLQGCDSCRAVWLQWHPGGSADGCVLQCRKLVLVAPATQHLHVHDVVRD